MSEKRVARLRRAGGVAAHAVNALARRFTVTELKTVWAANITALWTREGWQYLAVLTDLASRWDNAPVESFASSLKAELLPPQPGPTAAAAALAIVESLRFYNDRRLYSTLGFRSPVEFEDHLVY